MGQAAHSMSQGHGSATVQERRVWFTAGVGAGLIALIPLGLAAGTKAAPYVSAMVVAAVGAWVIYLLVLVHLWVRREMTPMLRAAHGRTPELPFGRWLRPDFADIGVIRPGSDEAAIHLELGTLSRQRLQQER